MGLLWDSRVASARRQEPGRNKSSGFVSIAFFTSNLLFAHSANPLPFAVFCLVFFTGGRCQPVEENFLLQSSQPHPKTAAIPSPLSSSASQHPWLRGTFSCSISRVGLRKRVGWEKLQIRSHKELFPLLSHTPPEPFHFAWRLLLDTPLF